MSNQYALILGASSGFGKSAAIALAKDGLNIIGVHLDRATTMPEVEQLKEDIIKCGVKAVFYNVNAADAVKRNMVLDSIVEKFNAEPESTIKILLHSLAFGSLKEFITENETDELNQKQLEMTLDVMGSSLVYWTQGMMRRKLMTAGGKIYCMTSSGGKKQIKYYGAVSAAKALLESFTRQLAMELGRQDIAVNALCAGVTDTPALKKIPNADKIIANAKQRNPKHELTLPEYVAEYIVNSYKLNSHWVTGNVINIDGGETVVEL
ncbi:SDR family oxidoreductase [soil metagenome]